MAEFEISEKKSKRKPPAKRPRTIAKAKPRAVKYGDSPVPVRKPKRKLDLMAIGEAVKAVARRVVHIGSYSALYPTAILNMAGSPSPVIAVCNVGFVVGAAAFIDYGTVLMSEGNKLGRRVFALGCLFIAVNVVNAGSNMAHLTGAVHDAAAGAQNRAGLLADQLRDIKTDIATNDARRAKQVAIADEKTVDAIEHDIGALTTASARNWEASNHCAAINPKSGAQKQLCADVQRLEGIKSAAVERDRLTLERGNLNTRKSTIESQMAASGDTPTSVDSFGDSLKSVAPVFGIDLSDARKNAMTPLKGWFWAGALEILSAFAPLVLAGLLAHLFGLRENAPTQPLSEKPEAANGLLAKLPRRRKVPAENAEMEADVRELTAQVPAKVPANEIEADHVKAFFSATMVKEEGYNLTSKEVWPVYVDFCGANNVAPLARNAFGKALGLHAVRIDNSGRPYFQNVRFQESNVVAFRKA